MTDVTRARRPGRAGDALAPRARRGARVPRRCAAVPLPRSTRTRRFAWTIASPMTAVFLGASYWSAVGLELSGALATRWTRRPRRRARRVRVHHPDLRRHDGPPRTSSTWPPSFRRVTRAVDLGLDRGLCRRAGPHGARVVAAVPCRNGGAAADRDCPPRCARLLAVLAVVLLTSRDRAARRAELGGCRVALAADPSHRAGRRRLERRARGGGRARLARRRRAVPGPRRRHRRCCSGRCRRWRCSGTATSSTGRASPASATSWDSRRSPPWGPGCSSRRVARRRPATVGSAVHGRAADARSTPDVQPRANHALIRSGCRPCGGVARHRRRPGAPDGAIALGAR